MTGTNITKEEELKQLNAGLCEAVGSSVNTFLKQCGDLPPNNLYQLVLEQVEEPMLELLMAKTNDNQTEVTRMLGLARGTVRTKLKRYGMIKESQIAN